MFSKTKEVLEMPQKGSLLEANFKKRLFLNIRPVFYLENF
jgi:hypothetical protein